MAVMVQAQGNGQVAPVAFRPAKAPHEGTKRFLSPYGDVEYGRWLHRNGYERGVCSNKQMQAGWDEEDGQ